MELAKLLSSGRNIRVIGFDDAHYADKKRGSDVHVAGIVCSNTRFEGMLWDTIAKDGMDSTDRFINMLSTSKFAAQVQIILTDGITFGGCNVVDIEKLNHVLEVPVVTVMRRPPDMDRFRYVVDQLPDQEERWRRVEAAGPIHEMDGFVFQVYGELPKTTARVLRRLTDQGKVPEALRLAHLIGTAIKTGESGKRA